MKTLLIVFPRGEGKEVDMMAKRMEFILIKAFPNETRQKGYVEKNDTEKDSASLKVRRK
jgi:hypothetical protein